MVQIRDPVHGMIELNEGEAAIIRHEAFQRLRRIHHLAMNSYVYPGATHTRFEHSLGVMHIADRMMTSLYKRPLVNKRFNKKEFEQMRQLVKLAALLHDVGHGPFSHGGEGVFPEGLKHEHYSMAIIKEYFAPIIKEYFSDIRVEQVISLLDKGYLSPDKVFLGRIIDGEMDADKLDYLLRDSLYCGVRYGKYDLERILDTLTIVPATEEIVHNNGAGDAGGVWLLGIDSDGIQAVEELIFARYWMFIQVYFHKTRRIYDYYLTSFLKDFLGDKFPKLNELDSYLALDDCTILEAIKKMRKENEWAKRIYERKHHSEAFVTEPHHTGLHSYMVISEMKERFKEKYGDRGYIDDKARKLPTNPLFGLKFQEAFEEEKGEAVMFSSIVVQDKHFTDRYYSIFERSLPLRLLSQKNINLVRFYVDPRDKKEAEEWCYRMHQQITAKVNEIEKGWS